MRMKIWLPILLLLLITMAPVPSQAQHFDGDSFDGEHFDFATPHSDDYFRRPLDPFWRTSEMKRESVLFLKPTGTSNDPRGASGSWQKTWPQAKLLFLPNEVVRVTGSDQQTAYEQGRDYIVDRQTGTLYLPPSSRIPFKTMDQLYPKLDAGDATIPFIVKTGDLTRGVLFGEDGLYASLQVEVSYTLTPGQWAGYVPEYAGAELPKTIAKLQAGQQIKIFIIGDSISQGYSSSKWEVTRPFQPPYQELLAGALQLAYHGGNPVVGQLRDFAVATWPASLGLAQTQMLHTGLDQPDLVLIAFGANDALALQDPVKFKANIQGIMNAVLADSPNTEFILVTSMISNKEWDFVFPGVNIPFPVEQFPLMRDALAQLVGPGVAMADVTGVYQTILQRKQFADITGNGVNHPNDFSHMVYAQTILGLLVPGPVAYFSNWAQTSRSQTMQLDGTGSLPGPNGPIVSYHWQMTPASHAATITGADTATPTITFNGGPGTYFLTLTVTDAKGAQNTAPLTLSYIHE